MNGSDQSDQKGEEVSRKAEAYSRFLLERQHLIQSKKEEEQKLIESILTLSSGAIGLIMTIMYPMYNASKSKTDLGLLHASLILFLVSLASSLLERYFSSKAYDDSVDCAYKVMVEEKEFKEVYKYKNEIVKYAYASSLIFFFIGILLISLSFISKTGKL